jgi:hypothetical protein
MQHVRVYAKPNGSKKDGLLPVCVDLCVDSKKMPIGTWPALGLIYDSKNEDQQFPFLVRQKTGTVDLEEPQAPNRKGAFSKQTCTKPALGLEARFTLRTKPATAGIE